MEAPQIACIDGWGDAVGDFDRRLHKVFIMYACRIRFKVCINNLGRTIILLSLSSTLCKEHFATCGAS